MPKDETNLRKAPQYFAAIAVTLGGLATGMVIGWFSPAQALLKETLGDKASRNELDWISSIMPLGAALAPLVMGAVFDIIGRKLSILVMDVILLLAWIAITCANSVALYCLGRFVAGFGAASFCVSCPTFIAEMAHKSIRGALGSLFQFQLVIGILIIFAVGEAENLLLLNITGIASPILLFLAVLFLHDSPVFLYKIGKPEKGRKALIAYRGQEYTQLDAEIAEIGNITKKSDARFLQEVKKKNNVKAFFMLLGLHIIQQLSGINAIMFYAHEIFAATKSELRPGIASIILGVVQLVFTGVSVYMVDRFGRRFLWILSLVIMLVSLVVVGVYFWLQDSDVSLPTNLPIMAVAFVNIYLVGFSLGAGPLPWTMLGELLDEKVKPLCTICASINWLLAFVVTLVFPLMVETLGSGPAFWIFGGICFLGLFFVIFLLIETKGKTLEEIQIELAGG